MQEEGAKLASWLYDQFAAGGDYGLHNSLHDGTNVQDFF